MDANQNPTPPVNSVPEQATQTLKKIDTCFVVIPYTTHFQMPRICPACEAPVFNATYEVSKTEVDTSLTTISKSKFSMRFPVCDNCNKASDISGSATMKGCLPSIGAGILGFLPAFFLSGKNLFWGLGIGAVFMAVLFFILSNKSNKALPKEIQERSDRLAVAVKIMDVKPGKSLFEKQGKYIRFIFSSREFAQQFASLNGGKITNTLDE